VLLGCSWLPLNNTRFNNTRVSWLLLVAVGQYSCHLLGCCCLLLDSTRVTWLLLDNTRVTWLLLVAVGQYSCYLVAVGCC